jgi:hypothetical protein
MRARWFLSNLTAPAQLPSGAHAVADHRNAPVNAPGYLRFMFAAEGIDETLEMLRKGGMQLVGEIVQYKDAVALSPLTDRLHWVAGRRAGGEHRSTRLSIPDAVGPSARSA